MVLHGCKRRSEHIMVTDVRSDKLIERKYASTLYANMETSNSMLNFPLLELPIPIICDIISRLPLMDIFSCRCVCKMFQNLLCESYFAQVHLARAATLTTNLVLQENWGKCGALHFFTCDHGESAFASCSSNDQNTDGYTYRRLHSLCKLTAEFSFRSQRLALVGSCNGLLCLRFNSTSKPFYGVCNPVLGECLKLPRQTASSLHYAYANHSGFGYSPKTKQYKVISFMHLTSSDPVTSIESEKMVAEVHTLGSNSWRMIENAPCPRWNSFDPFLNGSLHWITDSNKPWKLITSFNLEKETFKIIPPPAHFNTQYVNKVSWINVGVLRDCLCICYIYEDTEFDVWVMREYGVEESWTKEFSIDMEFYCKLRVEDLHRPIKFFSNGDLWFISSSNCVVSFCPTKRTFRELRSIGPWKHEVTAHDLSFISLKEAAGGRSQKVKCLKSGRRKIIFGI